MDAVAIRSKIELLEQQITTMEAIAKTAKNELAGLQTMISVCCSVDTPTKRVEENGRKVKYKTEELLKMAQAGWTSVDIAEFYGTSSGSIRIVLKQRGISLREEWRKAGVKPRHRRKVK